MRKLSASLSLLVSLCVITGCSTPEYDITYEPTTHTFEYIEPNSTFLQKEVSSIIKQGGKKSAFLPLSSGIDAIAARIGTIKETEKTLDLQYYIWHNDRIGKAMDRAVLNAANRGVKVRLLLDDMDTLSRDHIVFALDSHPNIEIRLFNPFSTRSTPVLDFVHDLKRINHRMHNKSIVADQAVTIFGGRNIGEEYYSASDTTNFADVDVYAVGPIAKDVLKEFNMYWESQHVKPLSQFKSNKKPLSLTELNTLLEENIEAIRQSEYAKAFEASELLKYKHAEDMPFIFAQAKLYYDPADKVNGTANHEDFLGARLWHDTKDISESITIISPYFVPGENLVRELSRLEKDGIKVRIITNSLASNDVKVVHSGYLRYRKALLKAGVEMYEVNPHFLKKMLTQEQLKSLPSSRASLHGKLISFDQRAIFVGSFNFDARSAWTNTEMGALIYSDVLAKRVSQSLKDNKKIMFFEPYLVKQQKHNMPYRKSQGKRYDYVVHWKEYDGEHVTDFDVEPYTGFWERFKVDLMSFLPIESYL